MRSLTMACTLMATAAVAGPAAPASSTDTNALTMKAILATKEKIKPLFIIGIAGRHDDFIAVLNR